MRSAPPEFSVAEAERIAREIYGLSSNCRPLAGERDRNFYAVTTDALSLVLKIIDGAASPESTDCQAKVLAHLHEVAPNFPVPKLLATLSGAPLGRVERNGVAYSTFLLGFLPGRMLAEVPTAPHLLRDMGAMLAKLDRLLRGFFHPALGQRIAWDVRRLPELAQYATYLTDPAVRRLVEHTAAAMTGQAPVLRTLRAQAIHGDCHGSNVLVNGAGDAVCGILDFGDMLHAPLILEPAVVMAELLSEGRLLQDWPTAAAALANVLAGFAAVESISPDETEVLYDLVTARLAVTVLVHAWRAAHDEHGARLLDHGAANAVVALELLQGVGRKTLTESWHAAAGTTPPSSRLVDLGRRRRLLGGGAELFYSEPLQFIRGDGVWLYDRQGVAYLDVYNNVPHVGHAHPEVVRAMHGQAARLATNTRYLHDGILDYAEALLARCPPHLDACLFVNSGSEANDVAWRLAMHATGRKGALVMKNAYHGITEAVAALSPALGHTTLRHVATLPHPPSGVTAASSMAAEQLTAARRGVEEALGQLAQHGVTPAAFFLDSALTSSGIFDPPAQWLHAVTELVRAAGALVVADEVQYGLGRSGSHFWGFQRRGLSTGAGAASVSTVGEPQRLPDIVTLGKPVGNGFPLGVVIANRSLIESFQARHGFFSTFGGNPVAAAAGLAVLRVLERERLPDNAAATGAYLRTQLQRLTLAHDCFGAARGAGLLLGLEVMATPTLSAAALTDLIVNSLASRARVLIGAEGPARNILKLRPPMIFARQHADRLVDALDAAAREFG